MTMTLGFVVAALAGILSFVGGLMLVIAGFRDSTKWGLLNLLVPFAALVFTFTHWREAKKGFLVSLAGGVLVPVAVMMIVGGAVASMGQQMEEQMALQMQQQMDEQLAAQQEAAEAGWQAQSTPGAQQPVDSFDSAVVEPVQPAQAMPEPEPVELAQTSLPEAPLPSGMSLGTVKPSEAHQHIGERFKFIGTDGSLFFGELLAVEGSHLRIKRDMQGGSVEYGVAKNEIVELRPIY